MGLTAHEWVRATIIADVFHWVALGLLTLIGFLVQRRLARRRAIPKLTVTPTPWQAPDRVCPECQAHHYCPVRRHSVAKEGASE